LNGVSRAVMEPANMGPGIVIFLVTENLGLAAHNGFRAQKINDHPTPPQGTSPSQRTGIFSNRCEESLHLFVEFVTITEQIDTT